MRCGVLLATVLAAVLAATASAAPTLCGSGKLHRHRGLCPVKQQAATTEAQVQTAQTAVSDLATETKPFKSEMTAIVADLGTATDADTLNKIQVGIDDAKRASDVLKSINETLKGVTNHLDRFAVSDEPAPTSAGLNAIASASSKLTIEAKADLSTITTHVTELKADDAGYKNGTVSSAKLLADTQASISDTQRMYDVLKSILETLKGAVETAKFPISK